MSALTVPSLQAVPRASPLGKNLTALMSLSWMSNLITHSPLRASHTRAVRSQPWRRERGNSQIHRSERGIILVQAIRLTPEANTVKGSFGWIASLWRERKGLTDTAENEITLLRMKLLEWDYWEWDLWEWDYWNETTGTRLLRMRLLEWDYWEWNYWNEITENEITGIRLMRMKLRLKDTTASLVVFLIAIGALKFNWLKGMFMIRVYNHYWNETTENEITGMRLLEWNYWNEITENEITENEITGMRLLRMRLLE